MKAEILKIAKDLENGTIDSKTTQTLLLGLFSVSNRRELLIDVLSKMYDFELLSEIEVTEIERRIDNANL
ncbi:MAG: hypothetical protein GF364_14990 [Candidatus Lokiarchaeota archaeon]|nr:hypothetical protein [Candidatus Lokiarchaeota archaeon]